MALIARIWMIAVDHVGVCRRENRVRANDVLQTLVDSGHVAVHATTALAARLMMRVRGS